MDHWTQAEAEALLGQLVVSRAASWKTGVVGHVHSMYRAGAGWHVTIAWHEPTPPRSRHDLKDGCIPIRETDGYSRREYDATLEPWAASLESHLGADPGPNPCAGLRCPITEN